MKTLLIVFIILLFSCPNIYSQEFHKEFLAFLEDHQYENPEKEFDYYKNNARVTLTYYMGNAGRLNNNTVLLDSINNVLAIKYLDEIYGIENREPRGEYFYLYRGENVNTRISLPEAGDQDPTNLYRCRYLVIFEWWEYE